MATSEVQPFPSAGHNKHHGGRQGHCHWHKHHGGGMGHHLCVHKHRMLHHAHHHHLGGEKFPCQITDTLHGLHLGEQKALHCQHAHVNHKLHRHHGAGQKLHRSLKHHGHHKHGEGKLWKLRKVKFMQEAMQLSSDAEAEGVSPMQVNRPACLLCHNHFGKRRHFGRRLGKHGLPSSSDSEHGCDCVALSGSGCGSRHRGPRHGGHAHGRRRSWMAHVQSEGEGAAIAAEEVPIISSDPDQAGPSRRPHTQIYCRSCSDQCRPGRKSHMGLVSAENRPEAEDAGAGLTAAPAAIVPTSEPGVAEAMPCE